MNFQNLQKYLSHYAAQEASALSDTFMPAPAFQLGLCLPVRGELENDINRLLQDLSKSAQHQQKNLIVIAVVNGSHEMDSQHRQANESLLFRVRQLTSRNEKNFFFEALTPSLSVLWVDRTESFCFDKKEGVGLARKIGCDLLCRMIHRGSLTTPWLWTTDADAYVPLDYFQIVKKPGSAFHYPYRHLCEGFDGALALILYEIHLRFYYLGLRWAGSPFAYPSVGSCLALDPNAYVAVRGFQNRLAGEDFHLMNKLRKVGPILYEPHTPISLRGRFSNRVPFGTGQSTIDIQKQLQQQAPFLLYDPRSFLVLRMFLDTARTLLNTPELTQTDLAKSLLTFTQQNSRLGLVFQELRIEEVLTNSYAARNSPEERAHHFLTQFDGLKTLRFIHLIERLVWPKIPWQKALNQAVFVEGNLMNRDPETVLNSLILEEEKELEVISSLKEGDG